MRKDIEELHSELSALFEEDERQESDALKAHLVGVADMLDDHAQEISVMRGIAWAAERLLENPESESPVDPFIRARFGELAAALSGKAEKIAAELTRRADEVREISRKPRDIDGEPREMPWGPRPVD